jgi:hypothetical protein
MSYPTLTPTSTLSAIVLPSTGNKLLVDAAIPYKIYSKIGADLYDENFTIGAAEQVAHTYKKLGGDVLDIELTADNVYSNYEEATLEYSYIINLHQATNTLARSLGNPTGSFDSHGNMSGSAAGETLEYPKFSFDYIRRIGMGASAEIGLMGSIEYSGSFGITVGQQDYDLQAIFEAAVNPAGTGELTFSNTEQTNPANRWAPTDGSTFTLEDAAGVSQEFTFDWGDNLSGAVADDASIGIAAASVGVPDTGTDPARLIAVQVISSINSITGLGITATIDSSDNRKVILTQDAAGASGNTTIIDNTNTNMTATDFTDGADTYPYAGKLDGKKILLKEVFYKTPHAMWRFFGYYGGLNVVGNLHNYGQFTDDATFQLVPVWENKAQSMAFEDAIYTRMSHFSYEIKNNSMLRLYPIPQNFSPSRIWVRFSILDDDSDNDPITKGVNNLNTLPFGNLPYKNINSIGKQWIRRFSLALSKETLGQVRSKFGSVPIPGQDLKLNGTELITQGKEEQKTLRDELQNTLKELTYTKLAESDATLAENTTKALDKIPPMKGIFVG